MNEIILHTEHGQEMRRRILAEYTVEKNQQMVDRLTKLMDEAGVPYEDFESRASYLIGCYEFYQNRRSNDV